ncbi:D-allose transport system permease protein AlsC [Devosia equisanguinis]|uniref:D-allose transport system permease protein AlsC n=1 Tax=Devosia equisanguinis TaxID=2490941 RepID=A0A3S4GIZ0_9HYPH|nr:ABC transporter permease [Devosia equisanguinis]VDS05700.1 D-allose transport system permease protein AlsC [Devosia equisanguinis]
MTAQSIAKADGHGRYTATPSLVSRILQNRYTGALVSLLLVAAFLAVTQPVFLTWPNLMNIVKSNSVVFILALGATYVVIAGGIDLSVASATAASAMIFGLLLAAGLATPVAVAAAILFGAFLGAINGTLISYFKISFFVVTLGALSMFQSFALIINDGVSVSVFSAPGFAPINAFVNGNIGAVPMILTFDVALLLIAGGVLRYTTFGRSLYAIGANMEAARLNGIDVKRVMFFVFVIAGLAAGLGSVVQVGRLTSASAEIDPTLLMTVLAAVLIGGTAFTGGEGGVFGTMIGVLFLGVIQNGLTLSGVSSFWQGMVSGGILIFAVWLGGMRQLLRRKRQSTGS